MKSAASEVTLQDVIAALERAGCHPKQSGDHWQAHCPAHEDSTPSLSITQGHTQDVLIKCFAGCEWKDVLGKLGLYNAPSLTVHRGGKPKIGPIVATYDYDNHYQVVRYEPKTFRQRRPDGLGGWHWNLRGITPRLYHQDSLAGSETAIVCEGEKDVDRLRALGPGWKSATCNSGGAGKWRAAHTAALQAAGVKRVIVYPDNDDPGQAHAQDVAEKCRKAGMDAKVVKLPDAVKDVSDYLDSHSDEDLDKLSHESENWDWTPPPQTEPILEPVAAPPPSADTDSLADNRHYRILGLSGDYIAVRISAGRVLQRTPEALCQPNTLIALAPEVWWHSVSPVANLSRETARRLGDGLIRAAYLLGPVDMSTIYGRGAVLTEAGKVFWHLGDRILADDQELTLDEADGIWLAEPRIDLSPSASVPEIQAAAEAVLGYRWHSELDGKRFLGWVAAAVAGGALEWRPHLMIPAEAGAGKSWLLQHVLQKLMGPLLIRIADGTPASVARYTDASSLPVVLEEADKWVADILPLLRIAAGGDGFRLRADSASRGVVAQSPRFPALISSTTVPDMAAADASRVSLVRLGREVDDWPKVKAQIVQALGLSKNIRSAMIRQSAKIALGASQVTAGLQADGGIKSRDALMGGALTAGWWWWGLGDDHIMPHSSRTDTADAPEALLEVLALRVRSATGVETSIAEALGDPKRESQIADLLGVKRWGSELLIAPKHRGLIKALNRTYLKGVDLRNLLRQISGVEDTDNAHWFGSIRLRALVAPKEVLSRIGIDFQQEAEGDLYE